MNITLVTVGKIKEKYFRDAVAEYQKRLSKYCRLDVIEVADEKTPDRASEVLEDQIKQKEAERILKNIKDHAHCIALTIDGKKRDSPGLAAHIGRLGLNGKSNLVFVIGGPYGFSQQVYDRANDKISLSRMTLTHEMVRLFFVEQLYRAMTILRGEPYHHD